MPHALPGYFLPARFWPTRSAALQLIETVAFGAAGGLLFGWAQLPGGLISGAMIAVAAAAIAGRPLALPPVFSHLILMTLGISLGSMVSPQMLRNVSDYPLTIGVLALATFGATFGSSFYLQRFHGWDRASAFLAGSPGALSQIILLATEKNADVPGIGPDHARHHPDRSSAAGAGPDRPDAAHRDCNAGAGGGAAIAGHCGGSRDRARPAAALAEISSELDVRRNARLRRAARQRMGRGRPAAVGLHGGADRHRHAGRRAGMGARLDHLVGLHDTTIYSCGIGNGNCGSCVAAVD